MGQIKVWQSFWRLSFLLVAGSAIVLLPGGLIDGVSGASTETDSAPTAWTVVPSADVSPTSSDALTSISCASVRFCAAVGASSSEPLIEIEANGGWTVSPFADTSPPTLSALTSVSCSSQKFCMAVGESEATGPYGYPEKIPAAETWNGLQWQLISVPTNPAASGLETLDELTSVSCLSPSFCAATVVTEGVTFVGSEPTSAVKGYVETWNGTAWSPQVIGNQPLAISCASRSFCTAVGTEGGAAAGAFTLGGQAFAAVFDGTSWAKTDFPLQRNNGVSRATLDTVSCLRSWCLATGTQQLFKQGPPGTYTSEGTTNIDATYQSMSWSSSSIPHPPVTPIGSSCTQPGNCVAVGQCSKAKCGVQESPLIEELTGDQWSFVPLTSGPVDGVLNAVSCGSATECAAVGSQLESVDRTLAATGPPPASTP